MAKKKANTIEIDLKRAVLVLPFLVLILWGIYSSRHNILGEGGAGEYLAEAGTVERFEYLSKNGNNACGLQARTIEAMADDDRIQGSCCSAMDLHAYQEQVEALKKFSDIPEIPPDPYDITVAQAKKLFEFQKLALTPQQQEIYSEAAKLSDEGGPCCCKCWHWDAYEGLAKYLISQRDWGAQDIAELWDLSSACGGPSHAHGS